MPTSYGSFPILLLKCPQCNNVRQLKEVSFCLLVRNNAPSRMASFADHKANFSV